MSLESLEKKYSDMSAEQLLQAFITEEFPGKIALVSSFGIEAALLLAMVAEVDPATRVVFLDTKKLFPETLEYRDLLVSELGLTNVKTYYPDYVDVQRDDPHGNLHEDAPNSCCYIRKVKPLARALKDYDAWITGRKRFHGGLRTKLPLLEMAEGKIKLNPLASWSVEDIQNAYEARKLPIHPLVSEGYTSVGCVPCTDLPTEEGGRSGRWKDLSKTECGIHLGADGKFQRTGSD